MSDGINAQVSPGGEDDLESLTDIYNHYVRETPATFDVTPVTVDERRPWLLSHPENGPHRLMVARAPGPRGRILGYATSSPFRARAAYATSVETSVYLDPDVRGGGIGTLLYERLFQALTGEDVHRAYAGITLPNEASVRIHQRFGFRQVGVYEEVGRKFGTYYDVAWFEKRLT
ncbi:GNAT family N-acetyltransferase [Actinacidiphila sp. ITFR-21]|uniref:GNAT family N-acetyltransferase n=1 Tax=Actinacidiphila sp. ITFR-21 TaxID=3075199 RepID=UPI00288B47B0|nr:N-acetyltransferase family protein [Streptomyces sp. ITFR-21]WNI15902.1 N-acetyltransferase family protein [Streptomyces sp. ITFR-21]